MAGTYHTQRKTGPSLFMVPKFSHRKDLRWFQEEPCRLTSNVANQAGPVPASSFPFTYKPSSRQAVAVLPRGCSYLEYGSFSKQPLRQVLAGQLPCGLQFFVPVPGLWRAREADAGSARVS